MVVPGWAPVPGVSYIRRERIKPASRKRFGKIEIPPDIAIEIVSPEQTVRELQEKCLRYAEVGVSISLIVDDDDETIYAIRPGQPLRVLRGDDRIDLDDVLPGFELTVQALFDSIVPAWLVDEPSEAGGASPAPTECGAPEALLTSVDSGEPVQEYSRNG